MSFVRQTWYATKPTIQILELDKNVPAKHCDGSYSDGNRKGGRPKKTFS